MELITVWALSHCVVTAPMTTSRPAQVRVCPPSLPTLRAHSPSYTSRRAPRTAARASRCMLRMLVTSLITRTPDEPILRNKPPVASALRSFLLVADSSAPSEVIVEVTSPPAPAKGDTVSVFVARRPADQQQPRRVPVQPDGAGHAQHHVQACRS